MIFKTIENISLVYILQIIEQQGEMISSKNHYKMDEIQWLKGKLSDQKRMGKSFLDKYYFWYNNDAEKNHTINQNKFIYYGPS